LGKAFVGSILIRHSIKCFVRGNPPFWHDLISNSSLVTLCEKPSKK